MKGILSENGSLVLERGFVVLARAQLGALSNDKAHVCPPRGFAKEGADLAGSENLHEAFVAFLYVASQIASESLSADASPVSRRRTATAYFLFKWTQSYLLHFESQAINSETGVEAAASAENSSSLLGR